MAENSVDTLDRARRRAIKGYLVGFLLWQVPLLTRTGLDLGNSVAGNVLLLVSLAGAVYWLIHLVRIVRLTQRLEREPSLRDALLDERYESVKTRALVAGFWGLLIYSCLLVAVGALAEPMLLAVGQLGVVLALAVPAVAFLVWDKE